MTREEAIKWLEETIQDTDTHWESCSEALQKELDEQKEVFLLALTALRPVSREQVEKMRGEWIIEDVGNGDRRKKCSLCNQPISGWWGRDRFCANCGSPMTDEAVQMVMERLEALKDGNEV